MSLYNVEDLSAWQGKPRDTRLARGLLRFPSRVETGQICLCNPEETRFPACTNNLVAIASRPRETRGIVGRGRVSKDFPRAYYPSSSLASCLSQNYVKRERCVGEIAIVARTRLLSYRESISCKNVFLLFL